MFSHGMRCMFVSMYVRKHVSMKASKYVMYVVHVIQVIM